MVGPEVAAHTKPDVIHGGILWVNVSDSVWVQQLNYLKYDLLGKINEKLAPEKLDDIRFRIGYGELTSKETVRQKRQEKKPDPKKVKEFDHLLEGMDSSEAKDALRSLWIAYEKNRKS